jgi:uncharacterized protein YggL (DUF469 family)
MNDLEMDFGDKSEWFVLICMKAIFKFLDNLRSLFNDRFVCLCWVKKYLIKNRIMINEDNVWEACYLINNA